MNESDIDQWKTHQLLLLKNFVIIHRPLYFLLWFASQNSNYKYNLYCRQVIPKHRFVQLMKKVDGRKRPALVNVLWIILDTDGSEGLGKHNNFLIKRNTKVIKLMNIFLIEVIMLINPWSLCGSFMAQKVAITSPIPVLPGWLEIPLKSAVLLHFLIDNYSFQIFVPELFWDCWEIAIYFCEIGLFYVYVYRNPSHIHNSTVEPKLLQIPQIWI